MSPQSRAPLKFQPAAPDALGAELRTRAAAYLHQAQDHRWADLGVFLKGGGLLAGVVLCLAAACRADSAPAFVLPYLGGCVLAMLAAMNVLHDAAHGALFRRSSWNRLVMRVCSLPLGIDTSFWTIRHVHFHHNYPNIEGKDLDIEPNAVLRQTPFHPWRGHYRFQHLYWPLVAALSLPYLNWYADWLDLFGRTPVRAQERRPSWRIWWVFGMAKAVHLGLMMVMPALLLKSHGVGWPIVAATYFGGQMLASCGLVALILGTHWADVAFYRAPVEGRMAHSWHAHAFLTSCDWQPSPRWLGHGLGGLHLHLTHHLFPTYSHRHYAALAAMVREVAQRHGLPYRCLSYPQLLRAQQRFLQAMGRGETQA